MTARRSPPPRHPRFEPFGPLGTFALALGWVLFWFWATCQFAASIEVPV
jgi:hypothetical protein